MKYPYEFTEDILQKSFKYKIKKIFLLSTDKYEKIVYSLFFISLFIYIRNLRYPLIYKNIGLEYFLVTEETYYSQLIENISLSIMGSSIFYIITEIFPYKRKKIEYSDEIETRIIEIYYLLKRILNFVFTNEEKALKLLQENKIREGELLLRSWEDIALFYPTRLVFEEVEKTIIEIREKLDKLLVFENFLDYEIRSIMYTIPRTFLFEKSSYSVSRGFIKSNIKLYDIYGIFEIVNLIRKYAFKTKKLDKILLELRNYESTISQIKKGLKITSSFTEYLELYRQYLKKKKFKKAKKYLILALKTKNFYLMSEEYIAMHLFYLEKENNDILNWEEYLEIRSEVIKVPKESKNLKELLTQDYLKDFN